MTKGFYFSREIWGLLSALPLRGPVYPEGKSKQKSFRALCLPGGEPNRSDDNEAYFRDFSNRKC